jgi:acetyl-CoA acetyltransferase
MSKVRISSAGLTRFGKRKEGLLDLMCEVSEKVLEGDVEAVYVGCQNPEEFTGEANISTRVATWLGLTPRSAVRIENSSASGSAVFLQAFAAVKAGLFKRALVVAGEKMTHLPTARANAILSEVLSSRERELGMTMVSLGALVARRYMHDHGLTREELALIPVKNHRNGTMNPNAHFQKEITVEKVLSSRLIASPLTLYDVAPISDGAAAVVLEDKGSGPEVVGIGSGTENIGVVDRARYDSLAATIEAARQAFGMARLKPSEVDIAEVHDAFSILELINMEDLGLCKKGKAGDMLKSGDTEINGRLPVNTSGGLKARGHPVGATGLAQVCEIFWQLTGNAGRRQVDGAKIGITQNIGGFGCNNAVTVVRGG